MNYLIKYFITLGSIPFVAVCLWGWNYTSTIVQERDKLREECSIQQTKIDSFDRFGDADPRHISASFAKTIRDHEAKGELVVNYTVTWTLAKQLAVSGINIGANKGIRYQIVESRNMAHSIREAAFLGARSGSVFFMIGLLTGDCRSVYKFPPSPKPVDILPVGNTFIIEHCAYSLTSTAGDLKFSIRSPSLEAHKTRNESQGCILHAWTEGPVTLFIVGFDDPDASTTATLPFKSERQFLDTVEPQNQLYPISSLNGCVCLLPLNLGREYDHRGQRRPWQGFPGDLRMVFCPIDMFDRPVVHTYVLQLDQSSSFWIPAYEVQTQLNAVQASFDLNDWIQTTAQFGDAEPIPLTITILDAAKARRVKLLESFRSLVKQTESM